MRMTKARLSLVCLALVGCAHHAAIPPTSAQLATDRPDFLDLQPGWRVRITTPLFSADQLQEIKEPPAGKTITLNTSGDLAYDTSYYAVRRDPGGAVRLEFVSGTVTRNGKSSTEPAGVGWKVQLNDNAALVRLVYLTRLSGSDHNMAVLAAPNAAALDQLTHIIDQNPDQGCVTIGGSFCAWDPARVAVVAEPVRAGHWEPVR